MLNFEFLFHQYNIIVIDGKTVLTRPYNGFFTWHSWRLLLENSDSEKRSEIWSRAPDSSVSSVVDLRTGVHWFNPRLGQYSFRGLMIVIATGFIPLSLLCCFNNGYEGKQLVAWKEYCVEYRQKEF